MYYHYHCGTVTGGVIQTDNTVTCLTSFDTYRPIIFVLATKWFPKQCFFHLQPWSTDLLSSVSSLLYSLIVSPFKWSLLKSTTIRPPIGPHNCNTLCYKQSHYNWIHFRNASIVHFYKQHLPHRQWITAWITALITNDVSD